MFASVMALSLGMSTQGADYYVDANAAKGGDGSDKAPYPTIQQAADVAQAGDTVFIKPGTYCETVKPKNSGKEGSPIMFRNCPGEEKPTICAGDRVTGPWKAEGGGIYSAPCAWNMGSARNHEPASLTNKLAYAGNVVVVNGDLMIEAREPNITGKEQLAEVRRQKRMFSCEIKEGETLIKDAPAWPDGFWNGGVLWISGGWAARNGSITNSQPSGTNCRIRLGAKTSEWEWWKGQGGCFLTGAKGALNQEKEFFLDEAANRLYLMAPGGEDPAGMTVYAKKRFTVIDMGGRSHVVFDGVNSMMGGILMTNATSCALRNGRHLYSSHLYRFQGQSGNWILGGDSARQDVEATSVSISGEDNRIEGCEIAYAATGVRLDGRNHVIRNCTITDIYGGNYFSAIYIAGWKPVGNEYGGHLIERNTIGRISRSAVSWCDISGGKKPTPYKKCRILYNHIFDFMENTEDGGAIYAWCVNGGGTEVAYNWIHGEHGGYHFNPAIYMDNWTYDFRYHHNVIWDVKIGIGWNTDKGGGRLDAYNNTLWARNKSLDMTIPSRDICRTYNNLGNKEFRGQVGNEMKNNRVTGPSFVGNPDKATSGLDFRPSSNSPAINAGVAVNGITEGSIGAPDAGAYEFGGVESVSAWTAGAGSKEFIAAPTFNPPARVTYTNEQLVAIGTVTEGAAIRYTTDGSEPSSTHGTAYSAPVKIGAKTVLKAVACKAGMSDSAVTWGTYNILCDIPREIFVAPAGQSTPAEPYGTPATAANDIQTAVDYVRAVGPAIKTVTLASGTYRISHQITIDVPVTVRSQKGGLAGAATTIVERVNVPWNQAPTRILRIAHAGAVIEGLTIRNGAGNSNGSEHGDGMGVHMTGGLVRDCIIRDNGHSDNYRGGGVYMAGGTISNCLITANSADTNGDGGGIYADGGQILNCRIIGNACGGKSGGGGICARGNTVIRNCLIARNTAYLEGGGGVSLGGGSLVENCTLVGNKASKAQAPLGQGGGVCRVKGSEGVIRNCIVYGNEAAHETNKNIYSTAAAGVTYTCTTNPVVAGEGNFSGDPLFANPQGGDYRVKPGSPCVDKGTNQPWMTPSATDLDGQPRQQNQVVDLGAYEQGR